MSKKHEWLPESVIGKSGMRPLDSLNGKELHPRAMGVSYSREGVKETRTLCNVPSNIDTYDNVTEEEWEVIIYSVN